MPGKTYPAAEQYNKKDDNGEGYGKWVLCRTAFRLPFITPFPPLNPGIQRIHVPEYGREPCHYTDRCVDFPDTEENLRHPHPGQIQAG